MKGRGGGREGGREREREKERREREREKGREGRERKREGKGETWIMQAKAIPRRRHLKERAPSNTPAFICILCNVTLLWFVIT